MHRYQKYLSPKSNDGLGIYVIDGYGLENKIDKGFLYYDIWKGIYGFPLANKLADTILKQRLTTCGYIKCMHTPGL